jgi:hypothetical protein
LADQVAHIEHRAFEHVALRERVIRFSREAFLDFDAHGAAYFSQAPVAGSRIGSIDRTEDIEAAIQASDIKPDISRFWKRERREIRDGYRLLDHHFATGPKDRTDIDFYYHRSTQRKPPRIVPTLGRPHLRTLQS